MQRSGLPPRTALVQCYRKLKAQVLVGSVYIQFTGDLLGLFGHGVGPLEVLVTGGAAKPRLAKVDPAGEEEASWSRPDPTLQKGTNLPRLGETAHAGEQGVLLTEDSGRADLDHGRPQILILLYRPDVPSYNCGEKEQFDVSSVLDQTTPTAAHHAKHRNT